MPEQKEYEAKTKSGYMLDEVVSALQKEIRRGKEKEAMFWAVEMMESGYGQYCWRRLATIAAEDVGTAEPMAAVVVNALMEMAFRAAKKWAEPNDTMWETIGMAVLTLCRAKKNGEVDNCLNVIWQQRRDGVRLEVPEYAIDPHTKRGMKENGGWWRKSNVERWFQLERLGLSNRIEEKYLAEVMAMYGCTVQPDGSVHCKRKSETTGGIDDKSDVGKGAERSEGNAGGCEASDRSAAMAR